MNAIETTHAHVAANVAAAGDWLTGHDRVAAWREARDAETNETDRARRSAISPNAVPGHATPTIEVVHRVASDPGRLTRTWADEQIAALGEETYTELVGVTAIASVLDTFDRAMGRPEPTIPEPIDGEPARVRPDDVGDVGAWVSQTTGPTRANVSRTLSLVPETNRLWRQLVDTFYSRGTEFMNLSWDFPLSRPQAELIAARTTALNECFY
ncbi:MAG: hypothetical protein HKN44_06670 [Ilumatobacter sp.]|nr:hypothetical protein [Ilumatobacter sp.]